MIVGIVFRSIENIAKEGVQSDKLVLFKWGGGIFLSMPIMAFAFTYHPNIFPIWNEMKDSSVWSIKFCINIAITICAVAYLSAAAFGYLRWYDDVAGNVLNNFKGDLLFDIIKIGYSLIICFSYPVVGYPARESLDKLIFRRQPAPRWRIFVVSLVMVAVAFGLAVAVPNINTVFGFVGATVGQLIVYILPALYFIILSTTSNTDEDQSLVNEETVTPEHKIPSAEAKSRKPSRIPMTFSNWRQFLHPWQEKVPAWLLVIVGVLLTVVGLYQIIYSIVNKEEIPEEPTGPPSIF